MKKIFILSLLFIPASAMAIIVDQSNSICGSRAYDNLYAVFALASYNCNSGFYLPADAEQCATCPNGFDCPGGTYVFNETVSQGLNHDSQSYIADSATVCASNFDVAYNAIFTPISYACDAGYYLPADGIECTLCPADNICVGGTYTYNETIDQGIVACAAPTPYAPSGSTVCYPHILHVDDGLVYLRSTKLTSPSLHIRIEDDVFYANMTTIPTRMNKDSPRYFHSQWDDNHYYICDDTTYPGE